MNFLPRLYISHLKTQLKRAEFLIFFMLVTILQVKEKKRIPRRHSDFDIGIQGYAWLESLQFFQEYTLQLSH
ncbi:MAG TPA: hypothetical protein DEG17_15315 [Cyanobacteria bacterium UBA11149]|nr:hypothetical protein [Cyanobacteria bacterium UBA11367]HBK66515.1 hypothetical protein [Cyanobacteria bacterium UBA11166]HBS70696.1 hypothetical protein [Cyanobacteria bacterium UBA11153]HBW90202.1 hypothetical protein [Cyanobacteria bacterium UBA11149]HCA94872.1 hypothetical protein [Cyanobacteria bacterium UBA9226]